MEMCTKESTSVEPRKRDREGPSEAGPASPLSFEWDTWSQILDNCICSGSRLDLRDWKNRVFIDRDMCICKDAIESLKPQRFY